MLLRLLNPRKQRVSLNKLPHGDGTAWWRWFPRVKQSTLSNHNMSWDKAGKALTRPQNSPGHTLSGLVGASPVHEVHLAIQRTPRIHATGTPPYRSCESLPRHVGVKSAPPRPPEIRILSGVLHECSNIFGSGEFWCYDTCSSVWGRWFVLNGVHMSIRIKCVPAELCISVRRSMLCSHIVTGLNVVADQLLFNGDDLSSLVTKKMPNTQNPAWK